MVKKKEHLLNLEGEDSVGTLYTDGSIDFISYDMDDIEMYGDGDWDDDIEGVTISKTKTSLRYYYEYAIGDKIYEVTTANSVGAWLKRGIETFYKYEGCKYVRYGIEIKRYNYTFDKCFVLKREINGSKGKGGLEQKIRFGNRKGMLGDVIETGSKLQLSPNYTTVENFINLKKIEGVLNKVVNGTTSAKVENNHYKTLVTEKKVNKLIEERLINEEDIKWLTNNFCEKLQVESSVSKENLSKTLKILINYGKKLLQEVDTRKIGKLKTLIIRGNTRGRKLGHYEMYSDELMVVSVGVDTNRVDENLISTLNHEYGHRVDDLNSILLSKENKDDKNYVRELREQIKEDFKEVSKVAELYAIRDSTKKYIKEYNYYLDTSELVARSFEGYLNDKFGVREGYEDELGIYLRGSEVEGILRKYYSSYLKGIGKGNQEQKNRDIKLFGRY